MAPENKMFDKRYLNVIGGCSGGEITFSTYNPVSLFYDNEDADIERYIINENATIIFWDDETKTISKRHKEDKFDKELGFLFAYFYKKYKGSKASRKRVIECIDYKKIKTFLFEFYVIDSKKSYDEAKRYLNELVVYNNK